MDRTGIGDSSCLDTMETFCIPAMPACWATCKYAITKHHVIHKHNVTNVSLLYSENGLVVLSIQRKGDAYILATQASILCCLQLLCYNELTNSLGGYLETMLTMQSLPPEYAEL